MKSLIPLLLLLVSGIAGYFLIKPFYEDILLIQADNAEYHKAIAEGVKFQERVAALTEKRNQLAPTDLERLEKVVPNNIDNVRLIIEINEIAKKY